MQDGAQAMIAAVRRQLKDGETLILMQGDISNAYGSIKSFLVLKTEKRFEPSFAALCAPQFVRIGTRVATQLRDVCLSLARNHSERHNILRDALEQNV